MSESNFWDVVLDGGCEDLIHNERQIVVTTAAVDQTLIDAVKWDMALEEDTPPTDYGFGAAVDAIEKRYGMTPKETDIALNICENTLKDQVYDET